MLTGLTLTPGGELAQSGCRQADTKLVLEDPGSAVRRPSSWATSALALVSAAMVWICCQGVADFLRPKFEIRKVNLAAIVCHGPNVNRLSWLELRWVEIEGVAEHVRPTL